MSYVEELFSLGGKTAVVTGAGRGLGRGIAEALSRAGARTLLVGRNAERLQVAREELAALGGEVLARPSDLGERAEVDALIEYIKAEFG